MMISPETFYKFNIEGKSEEDIAKSLNDLKLEIEKLTGYVESKKECFVNPSYETQLEYNKKYYDYVMKKLNK